VQCLQSQTVFQWQVVWVHVHIGEGYLSENQSAGQVHVKAGRDFFVIVQMAVNNRVKTLLHIAAVAAVILVIVGEQRLADLAFFQKALHRSPLVGWTGINNGVTNTIDNTGGIDPVAASRAGAANADAFNNGVINFVDQGHWSNCSEKRSKLYQQWPGICPDQLMSL